MKYVFLAVILIAASLMLLQSAAPRWWVPLIGLLPVLLLFRESRVPRIKNSKQKTDQLDLDSLNIGLSEARTREKAILENAVDVICILDEQSRILSINPACKVAWGRSADELIGCKLSELVDSEDGDDTLGAVLGSKLSVSKITFENSILHANGARLYLSWSAHWSATNEGLFCIARDVTERRTAELLLKESEERFRSSLEAMPVGVTLVSENLLIEYSNLAFASLAGFGKEEILGLPLVQLFQDSAKLASSLRTRFEKGKSLAGELSAEQYSMSMRSKSLGEPTELEVYSTIVEFHGKPKLLFLAIDVSQKRQLERFRRQFVAMINHDLRAPLSSLNGVVTLFHSGVCGELNAKGQELCSISADEISRLQDLVDDLLDLEKIESGNLALNIEHLSVDDIVEASISSVKTLSSQKGISLKFDESELACHADRSRCIQVLVNLLSNAIKYSPLNGFVSVSVHKLEQTITILVEDSGPGIAPELQAKLFLPFQQLGLDKRLESEGSGLGLSICKAIIQAHGGEIGYEFREGRSIFWFTLSV